MDIWGNPIPRYDTNKLIGLDWIGLYCTHKPSWGGALRDGCPRLLRLRPCRKRDKRRAPPLKKNILRDSSQAAVWYRIHVVMISVAVVFGLLVLCSSN